MPVDASAAKSIFLAALERPDRAAFLDSACAGDTDLRARVEALLAAFEAGSFPDYAPGADDTRTAPHTPDDPTRTGAGPTPNGELDLSFLAPPREPGNLGRLDHFEILYVVGQGGMGVVLKARDEALDRIVAIKVLAPQYAANAAARKRFIREAKAVAAVVHEHVVAIHGVNEQVPYLVMQLVSGISLQERIDRSGPLQRTEILRIGLQIAGGLAAAHKLGIVHRDIKPSNILLENGIERVKITDFGLARAVDDASVTQSGVIAGTPMYMSPEQARGEAVDPRSDLFSLGSVLYAMCTGHAPFRASGTMAVLKRVIEDDPRPPRQVNPDVPDWLEAIVLKLLAKNPDDRFYTAEAVARLLERHLAHEREPTRFPLPARLAGPPAPKPPARRRMRGWVAAVWVFILSFSVFGMFRVFDPILRPTGYLMIETDIPGLEVSTGDQWYTLDSTDLGPIFRPSRWATGSKLLFVRPGAYKVRATLSEHFVDEQEVLVFAKQTTHVVFRRPPPSDDPGWVSLFNQQDLTGWTPHPDQPGNWSVEKGILTGRSVKGSLFTARGDFRNFHLRVEGKFNPGSDAFLCLRAPSARKTKFGDPAPPDGYRVPINGSPFRSRRGINTAGPDLLPEELHLASNKWFKLEVFAEGNRFIVKVNDKTANDFTDTRDRYPTGHIGLHFDGSGSHVVQFKLIQIKELPTPIRDDDRIQGAWTAVAGERDGRPMRPDELALIRFAFAKDRVTASFPPKVAGGEGTYTLNPTASPKQVTVKATTDDGQAMEGIYRFDGDRLVLCLSAATDPRPTEFASKTGSTVVRVTLEREPAAQSKPAAAFALTPPQVLAHMAGTWVTEITARPDPSKSETTRHVGRTFIEPVAGGRFVRMRTITGEGGPDDLQMLGFDPDGWEFRGMYLDPKGAVHGPSVGRFDAATRTLTTASQAEDGIVRVKNIRFPDPDTITWEVVWRDRAGKTVVDRRGQLTRVPAPTMLPDDDAGAERPKEMAVLDRLVGTWDTEMASVARPGEKWKVELVVRKVLGGRFVETRERVLPSGEEHYTLYTYDPKSSAYRSWYFSSRWPTADGIGRWDAGAKTLTWSCQGGPVRTALRWTFVTDDRIEFRVTVTDRAHGGKVLEDIEGTHTRRKPPG